MAKTLATGDKKSFRSRMVILAICAATFTLGVAGCSGTSSSDSQSPTSPESSANSGQASCDQYWSMREDVNKGETLSGIGKKIAESSVGAPTEIASAASELSKAYNAVEKGSSSEKKLRDSVNAMRAMRLACETAGFKNPSESSESN